MTTAVNIGIVVSFFIMVISLILMIKKTKKFGIKPLYAKPQGDVKKGINYAFVKGMLPTEKESARNHIVTYFTGVIYHVGIFITIFFLFIIALKIPLPPFTQYILRFGSLAGFLCGMGLLLKRIISPILCKISDPDDYISNLLVNNFLLFGFLMTFSASYILPFKIISIVMFLYIPLGKIRHCAFFFVIRILFGMFYGRRGVYPTGK